MLHNSDQIIASAIKTAGAFLFKPLMLQFSLMKHEVRFNLRELFPAPWPAIWGWIILANIVIGLIAPNSPTLAIIRVGGIFLCLVYAYLQFPKACLLQSALLITFIADVILAYNNTAEAGVCCFFIAQIIHFWRIAQPKFRKYLIVFVTVALGFIVASIFIADLPTIFMISTFYIILLVVNIDLSWRWQRRQPQCPAALFATLGFMLFLCCDICTGVSYLSLKGLLPQFLYIPANFLAWFFYYPSQIFISNSPKYDRMVPKGR